MKIGKYFITKGVITDAQLDEALALQKDNPNRVVGEILVTLGLVTTEELILLMEMYMMETDSDVSYIDEWLDQDEVDLIMDKMD